MVILPFVKEVKKIEGVLLGEESIDVESSPFLQDFGVIKLIPWLLDA